MGGGGFAVFWWMMASGYPIEMARNLLLLLFVLFENFQTLNSRSEHLSVFRQPFSANPLLIVSVIGAQGLHLAAMYLPGLSQTLRIAPVSLSEWAMLLGIAATLLAAMEFEKWFAKRHPAAHDKAASPPPAPPGPEARP